MSRLGVAAGGSAQTFGGLAGVGDLMVTSMSSQSRNRRVGVELGSGRELASIIAETPMVAEGVQSAAPLVTLARQLGVELPIAERVLDIIEGRLSPAEAVRQLMERPAGGEWDAMGDLGLAN
jgi:glycerol-3-phosphate dehydrogenase (NAD(P)+)